MYFLLISRITSSTNRSLIKALTDFLKHQMQRFISNGPNYAQTNVENVVPQSSILGLLQNYLQTIPPLFSVAHNTATSSCDFYILLELISFMVILFIINQLFFLPKKLILIQRYLLDTILYFSLFMTLILL